MGVLEDLLQRVKAVDAGLQDGSLSREVVRNRYDDILELQKEQLFSGKTSEDEDIHPFYSEDVRPQGYFKSQESAKRYASWKSRLPYPQSGATKRNPDAPNLYINGKFHSELGVFFGNESVMVAGKTGYARDIVSKYGLNTFGLTSFNWGRILLERGAYDELMNKIKDMLYGK